MLRLGRVGPALAPRHGRVQHPQRVDGPEQQKGQQQNKNFSFSCHLHLRVFSAILGCRRRSPAGLTSDLAMVRPRPKKGSVRRPIRSSVHPSPQATSTRSSNKSHTETTRPALTLFLCQSRRLSTNCPPLSLILSVPVVISSKQLSSTPLHHPTSSKHDTKIPTAISLSIRHTHIVHHVPDRPQRLHPCGRHGSFDNGSVSRVAAAFP